MPALRSYQLFNLVGGNDLDAFNTLALNRLALFATTTAKGGFHITQFAQNVIAFDDFSEGGVFFIQERCVAQADKKLAARRIGISRTSHGEDTALMRTVIEFGFDFVAGIARAPRRFLAGIFGERIAALDHEPFHNAVKGSSIVVTALRKLLEILNRFGSDFRPEFHHHFPKGSLNHSDFVCVHSFLFFRLFFFPSGLSFRPIEKPAMGLLLGQPTSPRTGAIPSGFINKKARTEKCPRSNNGFTSTGSQAQSLYFQPPAAQLGGSSRDGGRMDSV